MSDTLYVRPSDVKLARVAIKLARKQGRTPSKGIVRIANATTDHEPPVGGDRNGQPTED